MEINKSPNNRKKSNLYLTSLEKKFEFWTVIWSLNDGLQKLTSFRKLSLNLNLKVKKIGTLAVVGCSHIARCKREHLEVVGRADGAKPKNPLKLSSHFKRNQKTATQAHLLRVKIIFEYNVVISVIVISS